MYTYFPYLPFLVFTNLNSRKQFLIIYWIFEIFTEMEAFDTLQQLGSGAYSTVTRVVRKRSSNSSNSTEYYALKTIQRSRVNSKKGASHVMSEKAALTALIECPYVVTLHDTFKDGTNLYFLLECVSGGPLHHHLRGATNHRFPISTTLFYATQVSMALGACHAHDFIYRDLKLSNILLLPSGNIKLTDFGFAKHLPWKETTRTYCGTPHAMAPEIIMLKNNNEETETNKGYDRAVDWWAFGILIYEMLQSRPPTGYEGGTVTENAIMKGHVDASFPIDIFGENTETSVLNFLFSLWRIDPATRLGGTSACGVDEVQAHPWMVDVVDDIRHGIIEPPVPNSNFFSVTEDQNQESKTLTDAEQAMFSDF